MNDSTDDENDENNERMLMSRNEKIKNNLNNKKTSLIKVKPRRKKKKIIFNELSFVENHVDTFYIGLNDKPVKSVYNPITAKTIDPDEASDLVKDWVHPDTQLVKTNQKSSSKKFYSKVERPTNLKIRPLEFVNVKNICENLPCNSSEYKIEESPKKTDLLKNMFDDMNQTLCTNEVTIMTPNKHKIYVNDTPIAFYGLSVNERRKKGLNC